MKTYLFLSLLVITSFLPAHDDQTYASYATYWADQYIRAADLPQEDIDAIIKLVASSLKRSQMTLIVQHEAWPTLGIFWQGWQNVVQTRLNPAKERPYKIRDDAKKQTERFWSLLEEYDAVCAEYAKISQEVVYKDVLKTEAAKKAVEKMRSDARVYMVRALSDVKKQLEGLYKITFKSSAQEMVEIFEQAETKGFSLSSFLLDYVPNLAMHKFVEADALFASLSQEGWGILDKVQLIGNQAWDAIETARAEFYGALLHELAHSTSAN